MCQFNIGLGLGYSAITIPQLKNETAFEEYNLDTTFDAMFGNDDSKSL